MQGTDVIRTRCSLMDPVPQEVPRCADAVSISILSAKTERGDLLRGILKFVCSKKCLGVSQNARGALGRVVEY